MSQNKFVPMPCGHLATPDEYRLYYTPQTLAEMWGCSTDIVYDLLRKGKLHGFKLGRDWRISDAAVQAYEHDPENAKADVYKARGQTHKQKNSKGWNRVV